MERAIYLIILVIGVVVTSSIVIHSYIHGGVSMAFFPAWASFVCIIKLMLEERGETNENIQR